MNWVNKYRFYKIRKKHSMQRIISHSSTSISKFLPKYHFIWNTLPYPNQPKTNHYPQIVISENEREKNCKDSLRTERESVCVYLYVYIYKVSLLYRHFVSKSFYMYRAKKERERKKEWTKYNEDGSIMVFIPLQIGQD